MKSNKGPLLKKEQTTQIKKMGCIYNSIIIIHPADLAAGFFELYPNRPALSRYAVYNHICLGLFGCILVS